MTQPTDITLFTADEASYVLDLIDSLESSPQLGEQEALPPTVIMEIDLAAIAMKDLGISDPIGQIANALKSWLQSLASWIVSKVQDLLKWLWDTFIAPAFRALQNLIDSIYHGILDSMEYMFKAVNTWVTQAASAILSALKDLFSNLWSALQSIGSSLASAIQSVSSAISSAFQQVYQWIYSGIQQLWSWIQVALSTAVNALSSLIQSLWQGIQSIASSIASIATQISSVIASAFQQVYQWIIGGVQQLWTWIQQGLAQLASALSSLIQSIWQGIQWIGQQLASIATAVSQAIASAIQTVSAWIQQGIETLWSWIQQGLAQLGEALSSLLQNIWQGMQWLVQQLGNIVTSIAQAIQGVAQTIIASVTRFFSQLWQGIQWIGQQLANIVSSVASAMQLAVQTITTAIYGWIQRLWSWIQLGIAQVINAVTSISRSIYGAITSGIQWLASFVSEALKTVSTAVMNQLTAIARYLTTLPQTIVNAIEPTLEAVAKEIWGGIQWLGTQLWNAINKALQVLSQLPSQLVQLAKYIQQLGALVLGGFNQLLKIPQTFWSLVPQWFQDAFNALRDAMEGLAKFFEDPAKVFTEIFSSIARGFWDTIQGIWKALSGFGQAIASAFISAGTWMLNALRNAIQAIWNALTGFAEWFGSVIEQGIKAIVTNLFFNPLQALGEKLEQAWFSIIGATKGELSLLFDVARQFLWEYYWATLMVYVISGAVEAFGNLEVWIEPQIVGSKGGGARFAVRLKDLVEGFIKAIKEFYPNFLLGSMFGLASTILRPVEYIYRAKFVSIYDGRAKEIFADVLAQEIKEGAMISVFVEAPTISELRDWLRRNIAVAGGIPMKNGYAAEIPKDIVPLLATFRAHLKLRGLPKWYIDYMSDMGQKLVVTFTDRFGKPRGVWLGEVFELPTHSELARMTQRDIFPSLYEMIKVAWTRGWNPDLTTLIYLLTFKYPSFEKLWKFYMRAVSGMLWFSPPETIAQVFASEAQAIGAGVPIAPLQIQRAIRGPDQLKAFELAINTYFKWLEYSNFSWFTPNTKLYNIPVGQMIYGALGGWTADSWIMADVAADIPTKIDMRWMSRYGIILWFAERAEKVGAAFASYTPMVDVIPKILEARPTSAISVDLKWFSKLIQATGLHPAWVPIVTVAENIMVISDEMTLLRTGWLHLFKEGMLTVDVVEQCLAGMLTVSYQVGYWDPSSKQWTTAWINLPVRWLPHERRLLELRMLMDRVYDTYREFYSFLRSGIRYLAITPDEAAETIVKVFNILNQHYSALAEKITGQKMSLSFDESFKAMWIEVEKIAYSIAIRERLRYWWYRVSGWLFYRIAYGYVSIDDVRNLINTIARFIPVTQEEKEAYLAIAEAIIGIVRREYVPTPSQLATIAEYVPEAINLIDKVLQERHVPKEWWPIWEKYVNVKPIANEVRSLIHYYMRAKVLGVQLGDLEKKILAIATEVGYTKRELDIINLTIQVEELIASAKEYIPTPSQLATIVEYVPEAVKFAEQVMEKRRVPAEWRPIWMKYIEVKPIANEVRSLLHYYIDAKVLGVNLGELEKKILEVLAAAGYTQREMSVVQLEIEVRQLIEAARQYIPTPSMLATIAEYVPEAANLIDEVLKIRRVPQEWWPIWRKYVEVKPIANEVRTLIHYYMRAKVLGINLGELEKQVLEIATAAGYTNRELQIIDLTITLEQMIENARQYIPTPSQLATIAEYVPEAASLAQKVLEARHVPPEWRPIWLKYIEVRPLANEVRRLASAFFRLKRYADIAHVDIRNVEREVLAILQQYGYTKKELSILDLAERLEVMAYEIREMAREWVPTISMLASLAEWMKIPQQYINEVFEKRHIPESWRGFWLRYLQIAPLRDDFRAFIHEYFYFVVWGWKDARLEAFAKKLMELMNFGRFEQELFELRARMRRKRYAWNEVRYWLRASLRNLAYGVAHGRIGMDEVNRFFARLKQLGYTDEEINAMRMYFETYVISHRR